MRFLRQFTIILIFSFLGEVLHRYLPLPVPASIYGMMLLFASLLTGIVKLEMVRDAAGFLIAIMPVMFIPAAAELIDIWSVLRPLIISYMIVTVISTIAVMGVTGKVTDAVLSLCRKPKEKENV